MIDRRQALVGAMAMGVSLAAPAPLWAARIKKPPRLRLGDTVGIVAPASAVSEREIQTAAFQIEGMGLVPRLGANIRSTDGYLAGSDAERAGDIDAMFGDEEVRAIFALRGGWGGARLLPLLDWDRIRANPKLLIGYSDVTALHLAFAARAGFATIHSPNASSRWTSESWNSLWRLAFTGETPVLGGARHEPSSVVPQSRTIRAGLARGRLLGGNLTVLSTLMGTPWLPDFDGAILFLEDVNEAEYRVDRMLRQLALAGILERAGGVVFGTCRSCASDEPDYGGFSLDRLLDDYLGPLDIPAFVGANVGHIRGQLSLPHGAEVELDAGERTIRLLEPIVS